jgi:hypothetical protein
MSGVRDLPQGMIDGEVRAGRRPAYDYGYGILDVGGYYGGWWGHDDHWHPGFDGRGGQDNFRGAEAHAATRGIGHAAAGGHGGGGGHR